MDSLQLQEPRLGQCVIQNHERGRLKGLQTRQERAFEHAFLLDSMLSAAIESGEFDARKFDADDSNTKIPAIGLTAFTEFLRKRGGMSASQFKNGDHEISRLSPTGLQRALAIRGRDWQHYCTKIMERRVAKVSGSRREADFYEVLPDFSEVIAKPMHPSEVGNMKLTNSRRNDRWKYILSPSSYHAAFHEDECDFKTWLHKRYLTIGCRHYLHPMEREQLRKHLWYENYVKYGWFSHTYVRPEFCLPRIRPRWRKGGYGETRAYRFKTYRTKCALLRRAEVEEHLASVRASLEQI